MGRRRSRAVAAAAAGALLVALGVTELPDATAVPEGPSVRAAAAAPLDDPFFDYTGSTPLRDVPAGTVLKKRTIPYSIQGLDLPLKAVQLLYRTTNQVGRAVVNVTTVVRPVVPLSASAKVVSYQSFYDSLDPADQPSAVIAGGSGLGAGIVNIETLLFAPLLLAGYTINIPDTEGQSADFAAGPEYGVNTLDSLRAISGSAATGVGTKAPIGLIGYSGGAIASEWAAELAASYTPRLAARIVGTAIGGVLVHPGHNLHYIDGSSTWAGVIPMALVGIARSFHIDLSPYLSAHGKEVMAGMRRATISEVLGAYPGLTWADLAKPRYAVPEQVPLFVHVANQLIMSTGGTPSAPMFIGQGTGGELEGTPGDKEGIGPGDGVMIAGDVRTLARRYCARGVVVHYEEYALSHFTSVAQWLPASYAWLLARFGGSPAPSSCGAIPRGNPITPIKVQ